MANFFVGIFTSTYFIIVYMLLMMHFDDLKYIEANIPILYNRIRFLSLTYGIARVRVFHNNSLECMETDPVYGKNIDNKYNDLSITNEGLLTNLKVSYNQVIKPLIN
jgi:hypothetical protein